MDERLLKRYLSKYNENKKIKADLELQLVDAENKAYGISGKWVAKLPQGTPPDPGSVLNARIAICDRIRAELQKVNDEIDEVDKFIKNMADYKNLIEDKFINEISGDELADKYGYSRQHIYKLIDRLLVTWAMMDEIDAFK